MYICCFNFQLVIVMNKGQVVVLVVIVEYVLVTLILVATNVRHVMTAFLTFLHVHVRNTKYHTTYYKSTYYKINL